MSQSFEQKQLDQLNTLVRKIADSNRFYRRKLEQAGALEGFRTLDHFHEEMPFTTKSELADDQVAHPPFGSFLTYPVSQYTRYHQTSGTSGRPLIWLDDQESWQWVLESWKYTWRASGAQAGESAIFAFSFGPFIGFWAAFDSATQLGIRAIPAGGMGSADRLRFILTQKPTYICCTPTYALRLVDIAEDLGYDLADACVKCIIVGGEPGGSIPEIRDCIESGWKTARVLDHHGMTEVGPVSHGDLERPNLVHLVHDQFHCEVLDPETNEPVREGETGELILTTLGRYASPLVRYRTRDLVKPVSLPEDPPERFALEGGILGRADDMVVVRGVNLYPSAVESVIRSVFGVREFQVEINQKTALSQVSVRLEIEG
ncbi:MAG: AMP-binding protein, partial [Verrucomicrobiae bacterium]|nr:AMP-binding protein [Verrucomicrobiae bacterium]